MTILSFFNSKKIWETKAFTAPWELGRQSIFEFVKTIDDDDVDLPDEQRGKNSDVSFAAGALDGIFSHHSFGADDSEDESNKSAPDLVTPIMDGLNCVLKKPNPQNISKFYSQITSDTAMSVVDDLIDVISTGRGLSVQKLEIFLLWVAKSAPDRDAVKIAIALLGMYQTQEHRNLFLTLGKHSEFTLYSAVALSNSNEGKAKDIDLWELAQTVQGWGRIQTVERLAGTKDPTIKAWMVREGYKNTIMYEYLAWFCAEHGDLAGELKRNDDEALLLGAADILRTLLYGGPAQDMGDYENAGMACVLFLHKVEAKKNPSSHLLLTAAKLRGFINDAEDNRSDKWSSSERSKACNLADKILNTDQIKRMVMDELASESTSDFWITQELGEILGIDVWPYLYDRQSKGIGDEWFSLMRTDDERRIDKVLNLAKRTLPLDKIATGPGLHNGFGPDYQLYSGLDYILQGLPNWPGKGWRLLKIGLRSPVIRHRHQTISSIETWRREMWPKDAQTMLHKALKEEPDSDLKTRFEKLLSGEPTT